MIAKSVVRLSIAKKRANARPLGISRSKNHCLEPSEQSYKLCRRHLKLRHKHDFKKKLKAIVEKGKARFGLGLGVTTFTQIQTELGKGFISPNIEYGLSLINKLISTPLHKIWILDFEFLRHDGITHALEIGGMNLTGTRYQRKLLPQVPIEELKTSIPRATITHATFLQYFGKSAVDPKDVAIDLSEAMTELSGPGLTEDSILIEWSANYCDWRLLTECGEATSVSFPPGENSHSLLYSMKRILLGLYNTCSALNISTLRRR